MSDWRHRWLTSAGLGLGLLTEMEYIASRSVWEESSELYFEVRGTSKWWSSADGWGQGFVVSKEVWDEILGELSAF